MSDMKSAKAVVATGRMDDTILELFITDNLPTTRQFCLKKMKILMGYDYNSLRKYNYSNLYTISQKTIDITADNELLASRAKEYAKRLIIKNVFPSKYEKDCFEYNLGKYFDHSYFTEEEKQFIDLMFHELLNIANLKEFTRQTSISDLNSYNNININSYHVARKVYNDILQKKLHAGDNVISYFTAEDLSAFEITRLLDAGEKFDCYYNQFAILKCDLETNKNILIKNFLNTVIYLIRDPRARYTLLLKLNSQYPVLQNEKIFYEFS